MTYNENKLAALESAKSKMAPGGSETSFISGKVQNVCEAFDDYIKSDNIFSSDVVKTVLLQQIEEHPEFCTSVSFLDKAISATAAAIEAERAEAAAEAKRLLALRTEV